MSENGEEGENGDENEDRDDLIDNAKKIVNDHTIPTLLDQGRITEEEAENLRGFLVGRTEEDTRRLLSDIADRVVDDDEDEDGGEPTQ